MIGKVIGATIGRKAARTLGTTIGGPAGAAIGYGLASRRFRKLALGGLAVMGGLAAYRKVKEQKRGPVTGAADSPAQERSNEDPLPVYAPHS